ncbi:MAG: PIN domain-containing protein [Burkholderiales bacterium]|nr:PIN domain-containing protein [Burkholderiales bacterium]
MSGFLLDVNVLVSLLWPAHIHHEAAQKWFAENSRNDWATTPITQAAFVRIVSNPAFSRDAVVPDIALELLLHNLKHRHHRFWPDDLGYGESVADFRPRLIGHKQVTDAYLLGLARHHKGKLATFDQGISGLTTRDDQKLIELLPQPE